MTDIHDDHFRLWAASKREGVNNGYPKAVPWYTPPRRGNESSSSKPFTDEDYMLASLIDKLAYELTQAQRTALVVFWGAYPNASLVKKERYRDCNVDPSNCRKMAKTAMQWISRQV